jgi:hypothetical protein
MIHWSFPETMSKLRIRKRFSQGNPLCNRFLLVSLGQVERFSDPVKGPQERTI